MKSENLSLVHEILHPKEKSENPPLLLMLHGYGSHEKDLFALAPMLNKKYFIVSARAPISLGFGGFAWFDISIDNGLKVRDYEQAKTSMAQIEKFIVELKETYGLSNSKTDIFGFSQGCMMSYALAFNSPLKYRNIMALSGYVLKDLVPEKYKSLDLKSLDFFVSHGASDDVLPIEGARLSVGMLEQMNISHQYREYPIGHGISPVNFADLQKWLKEKDLI